MFYCRENNSTNHFYIFSKGGFTSGLKERKKHGEVTLLTLEYI